MKIINAIIRFFSKKKQPIQTIKKVAKKAFVFDSVDTIPAKLYYKIVTTGDISLLCSEKQPNKILEEAWENIQNQDAELSPGGKADKIINVSRKIEALAAKYEFAKLAVYHLENVEDEELINQLKKYGYKFSGDLQQDLKTIARENKALILIIKRYQKQLPQQDEESTSKSTLDENILSYGIITGLGFIDTNTITLSQYRALVSTGNQKIKALEDGKQG